jgi:quercetin dioxygenase-like cupin family protein
MSGTNAVKIASASRGPHVAVVGDLYSFFVTGEETGGGYAAWVALVPPGGGPPPHRHSREDESFYVLEGELAFYADGRRTAGGPGTFLHLPRGGVHRFANETDRPARVIITVVPAGLEKMFFEAGVTVTDPAAPVPPPREDEIARSLAAAPRYGVEILVGGPS